MPNHCLNKLTISGDPAIVREFFNAHTVEDEDGEINLDMKSIMPLPAAVNISASSYILDIAKYLEGDKSVMSRYLQYPWMREELGVYGIDPDEATPQDVADHLARRSQEPDALAQAQKVYENRQRYNAGYWYEWCTHSANWGIKWGAYDGRATLSADGSELVLTFSTAWKPFSESFWEEMTSLYPELTMSLKFFEPGDYFAGEYYADQDEFWCDNIHGDEAIQAFAEDHFGYFVEEEA